MSAPEYDKLYDIPVDSEEVFETTVDDGDVTVAAMTKKANRTLSTEVTYLVLLTVDPTLKTILLLPEFPQGGLL